MTTSEAYKNVQEMRRHFDAQMSVVLQAWSYLDVALRRYEACLATDEAETDDV